MSGLVLHHTFQYKFPYPTFIVNVLGCCLAGILVAVAEKQHLISPEARLFALTGVLGGFTTFSAFGVETIYLMKRGEYLTAATYVILSVFVGLAALWLATRLFKTA